MPLNRSINSLLLRPERCRFALGLAISNSGRQIRGSLVAARGAGLDMRLEIAAQAVRDVPGRLVRQLHLLLRRGKCRAPARAAVLAAELAEQSAMLAADIEALAPQFASRADVIGVTEPGLWTRSRGGLVGYLPLSDPARLADLSGLSVIDAFPARDLAQDGRGGPLEPLADWLLLHHPLKNRVLVDLGLAVRVTYLPAGRDASAAQGVMSFVAGPGLRLVDAFARRYSEGRERIDQGGHLAVQGARIDELLAEWLGDPQLTQPQMAQPQNPPVRPGQFPVGRLVRESLAKAVGRWSVQDLLCTAVYLVAELAARAVREGMPSEPGLDEVIVTGGGQQHGLLFQCLAERLSPLPLVRAGELLLGDSNLPHRDGAIAAILALLHLDQTPACPTALSGARTPRVLGRLTPGSPQSWQRLLQSLTARCSAAVSLRSAI